MATAPRKKTASTARAAAPGRPVTSLDSLAKQKLNALPDPVTYELLGVEFTLPPMMSLPFEMQERVGNLENIPLVLKEILGEDKVEQMYKAGYKYAHIELIAETWQKNSAVEPGESAASSGS
ncbi:hypothetical protein [Streptomyces sp. NPDC006285]|uniref:hypothetical protein n=1 Tax=Streptomyces sp. NPDC006285 TaxID=3364742 RepID=UPI003674357C